MPQPLCRFTGALLSLTLWAASASAQVFDMGEVVVVPDPTGAITNLIAGDFGPNIYPSRQEQFCRAAYNNMRASGHADEYDGIIAFSTSNQISDLSNVWQGSPVRSAGKGIGRDTVNFQTNLYNSNRMSQCVFMGTLGKTQSPFFPGAGVEPIPPNPESTWSPSIGVPIPFPSLTGIEMFGHEFGHYWLMGIEYDLNDGRGKRHLLRGTSTGGGGEGGGEQMNTPNQHYSAWADSRSVMYGSCLEDTGGGHYEIRGCPRKYNHIDQYLMGLRSADEVEPMLVLEDPQSPGNGIDSIPPATGSKGPAINGTPKQYRVTGESIVRAMGPRAPAYPNAKNCWRIAFVVVLAPGETTLSKVMYDKVERYRYAWSPWFMAATDYRGTMDSRAHGEICIFGYSPDGGVPMMGDAGVPIEDAGIEPEPDAGDVLPEPDAGPTNRADGGTVCLENCVDIGYIKPSGCGCGAVGGFELFAMASLLLAALRRSR